MSLYSGHHVYTILWLCHVMYPPFVLISTSFINERYADFEYSRKDISLQSVLGGGTWIGSTKDGRLAFLTNALNGFNLILADLTRNAMVYVSNRPKGQPCNDSARLTRTPYVAIRLGKNFREFIRKHGDDEVEAKDIADRLMADTTRADKDRLPNTGCEPNWEHGLTSIFIEVQTDKAGVRWSFRGF
ncbi:hypothetical protein VPH35_042612 [Triticum aestivum]